jgi:PAS domain S-box-containing protein
VFAITGSRLLKTGISRRYTAFFLLMLLIVSCAGLVYSAQAFRDRIDAVRASDSDNAGWLISQLDVDHKALSLAIDRTLLFDTYPELAGASPDLSVVRLRFDIFYSRVNTVLASLQREQITQELRNRLSLLDDTRDVLAAELDLLPEGDDAGLLAFAGSVQRAGAVVRDITTMSLLYHVSQSDRLREMERSLLKRFWIQSLVLLVLMIASALLAVRLWRQLEEEAVKTQRALDTVSKVFDVSISAVVVTDMDGKILIANPSATRILGAPAAVLQGKMIDDVLFPKDHVGPDYIGLIGTGPLRMDAVRMDGTPFKADISVVMDHDLDGKRITIGFVRDISDIVAAEEKLLIARDEAERHASAKTMFLATMSHEMRTPLHGVIASLDLIDARPLDEESRILLQTAKDCSDRALQQVNDVLEITRLGESQLGDVAFRPSEVAADIQRELTPMAVARGVTLDLEVHGPDSARQCLGLPTAFSRALYNLAGNAVKFTDDGGVKIILTFVPQSDAITRLKVEVRDTGIGIAPEDQQRIFTEFETLEGASTYRGSGTGLGLPIVKLAVARMGGVLSLTSAPGKGSSFCFEINLPFAEEAAPLILPEGAGLALVDGGVPQLEVLIVDDNPINVTLMTKMVTRLGHRAAQATNGLEAVAMASGRAYDVILMDVSMPIMDGREATGHIRASGLSMDAVIIGVTAFSDEDRLRDLTEAGMDAVVTKPINTAQLAATMRRTLEQSDRFTDGDMADTPSQSEVHKALSQLEDMLDRGSALRFLEQALQDVDSNIHVLTDKAMPLPDVADRIHSTVGSTAVVGLSQLSHLLAEAETTARSGDRTALKALHARIAARLSEDQDTLRTVHQAA